MCEIRVKEKEKEKKRIGVRSTYQVPDAKRQYLFSTSASNAAVAIPPDQGRQSIAWRVQDQWF